jgi:1-deoxy-D-xylulose-5-phosphate reductoisomerase
VLNAANEVAVQAFLDGQLSFPAIWGTVAAVMEAHRVTAHPGLGELIDADAWARRTATERLG